MDFTCINTKLCILAIVCQCTLAWKIDTVVNITVSVARMHEVQCITVLNPSAMPYFDETEITVITKQLQMKWIPTKMASVSDYDSPIIWKRCSVFLTVILGSISRMQQILPEFTKKKHQKLEIFLIFLPNLSAPEIFFQNIFLPFTSRMLAISSSDKTYNLTQIWRVSNGYPIRSQIFGMWDEKEGLICPKPRCNFHLHSDLEGFPLRGATKLDLPISAFYGETPDEYRIIGYFGVLYETLLDTLNATMMVVKAADNATGTEVDGKWNGLVGMMVRDEIDLGVGPLTVHSKVLNVADFVWPLLRTSYQVFFKQAGNVIEWDVFMKPFHKEVWGSIFLCFILATYMLHAFHQYGVSHGSEDKLREPEFNIVNAFLGFLRALSQQGAHILPFSLPCRIIYLTGYLTSSVLLTAYSGSLISKLTVQPPARPFDTLETFLKEGSYSLMAIGRSTDYTYFSEAKNPLLKEIYKKHMAHFTTNELPLGKEDGMMAVCKGHKVALFITFTISQITARDLGVSEGCRIINFRNDIATVFLTMGVKKGLPYSRAVEHKVQLMAERGILYRLQHREWPLSMRGDADITLPPAVELQQVAPIYCVLISGILLSWIILIVEILSVSPRFSEFVNKVTGEVQCETDIANILLLAATIGVSVWLLKKWID